MTNGYREDLAYVHDAGFGQLARSAAAVLIEELAQHGTRHGLVVDLGCGSGITAQALCATGYDVLGIDISPDLIAIARTRVPHGQFQAGSFLRVAIPPCVAVTAIGECFNYVFDSGNTTAERLRLFRHVYTALVAGGVFLFDVATPGRVPGGGPLRTYTEGEDWVVLMTAEEDPHERQLTRRITTFRQVGELYRRAQEVHRLHLFDHTELLQQLQSVGFGVQVLAGYGPSAFAPGHAGFLARKS